MFVEQLRRAVEASPRAELHSVSAAVNWLARLGGSNSRQPPIAAAWRGSQAFWDAIRRGGEETPEARSPPPSWPR